MPFSRIVLCIALACVLICEQHCENTGLARAQATRSERTDDDHFLKARVHFTDSFGAAEAEAFGVELEHSVLKADAYVESIISRTTLGELRKRGIRTDILLEDAEKEARERIQAALQRLSKSGGSMITSGTPRNFRLGTMGGFYTLQEIHSELARMRAIFPLLVSEPETIGESVEGAPIYAYRICSASAVSGRKPEVLYTALHHAREPGSASSLIYFLWSLLERVEDGDAEARYLLNNRQLFVVPVVNPDGYLWNQTSNPSGGGLWRKNRRMNADGSFGVDLNRNYGTTAFWNAPNNGSSTAPRSDTYRGSEPFSEPETRAIRDFCLRRSFRTAINYHTFSNLLIYPYSYINLETPDSTYFRALTAEITKNNLYSAGRDIQTVGYAVRGASDDWMYAGMGSDRKIMAYTPEVGSPDDGFWPSPDRIIPHGAENLATNLMTAWSAGVNLRPVQTFVREHPQTGATRLIVDVQNIGVQDADGQAQISLRPLRRGITVLRPERTLRALRSTEMLREIFDMVFDSTVKNGDQIPAELILLQESTPRRDTILIQVREAKRIQLFAEASDMRHWQQGRWGIVSDNLTGKPALTDSPAGLYRANDASFIQLAQPFALDASLLAATLEFQVRWSVESNGDLAVAQVSDDNGTTWSYLRTSLMKPGTYVPNLTPDAVGYDGNFPQWIRQECSLNRWLGKNILFRFGMISDGSAQFDGMYLSDIALRLYSDTLRHATSNIELTAPRITPNIISQGSDIRLEVPLANLDTPASIAIYNLIGQRVMELLGQYAESDGSILLPSLSLARGMYIVEIRQGNTFSRSHFIIQ